MVSITSILLVIYSQYSKLLSIFYDKRFLKRIKIAFFGWASIFIFVCIFHNYVLDIFWDPIKSYVKYSGNKLTQSNWEKPWFDNIKILFHTSLWLSFPFFLNALLKIYSDLYGKKISSARMSGSFITTVFIFFWIFSGIGFFIGINQFDDYFRSNQISNSDFVVWKPDLKECLIWYIRLSATWIIITTTPFITLILERLHFNFKFQKYLIIPIAILMFDYYKISSEFLQYTIIISGEILLFSLLWSRILPVFDAKIIKVQKVLSLDESLKRLEDQKNKRWAGPNSESK
jgi:hypothetical protein